MVEKLTVLNPEGSAPRVDAKALTPRPESLDGKTVFLVDVGFDNSDVFMQQLHEWFAEHHPEAKTIQVRLKSPFNPDPETYDRIKSEGDLAVLGIGL